MSKNRETGTEIHWVLGMMLLCVDHGIYSPSFSDKRTLLMAKAHPLQWCALCKEKGR